MPRRVVVTGGSGFVGQWLARSLLNLGDEVWLGGIRRGVRPVILSSAEWSTLNWIKCDVRSDADVDALISRASPDLIVHLAGVSSVPTAERSSAEAYEINVLGAVRVAKAANRLREAGKADPVFLVVGSGTQYGAHPESEMPLAETATQRPMNVYARTKAAQEAALLDIGRATGLRVIATRSFNHSGIGHDPSFLLPSLARRVREVSGASGILHIGNDVVRDYLHVDDVVAAYLALADRGIPGEAYNVCSGERVGVTELANACLSRAGTSAIIVSDPDLQRPVDTPILVGSPVKLKTATGWMPKKSYRDIIDDLLATT